ncbi:hypothetical protein QEH52_19220 [Coraliomargarita sp. SDUM461003]|uniref:Uncharacterized protein n=1 Tax=Thalassobacterium maritimum TaxID=3041265 RepID=A0ABU1AZU7_9BACT|nr:hypothetical protein [Coraliomargarita sp. SDUM461003]MDQ8209658.1 hypothetical protein [Coraliomargarita sp. SDUM461003]
MKKLIPFFLLTSLLAEEEITDPFAAPAATKESISASVDDSIIKHQAAIEVLEQIKRIDRIECILMDPTYDYEYASQKENWIGHKEISEEEELLEALEKLSWFFRQEGIGAMCMYPVHEMRCYTKEKEILKLTICWGCNQSSVWSENVSMSWGLGDYKPLEEFLIARLPIPDEFMDMREVVKTKTNRVIEEIKRSNQAGDDNSE